MGIELLIMEKSWNCVFEFLWDSCISLIMLNQDTIPCFENSVNPDQLASQGYSRTSLMFFLFFGGAISINLNL